MSELTTGANPSIRRTLFLLLVLATGQAAATGARAELVCRAEVNRESVTKGGVVVLTVTAEGDADWSADFVLPDLPGIQVSGGGTNQSMSFVGGRRSVSVSRTYYLRVDRDDDFTIGPVRIASAGKGCATNPVNIRVEPASSAQTPPPADTGNRTPAPTGRTGSIVAGESSAAAGKPGDEVFVTLEADRTDVWVGQQILLRFRYWRRIQPWNNPQYVAPRTEGFWREDLGPETNYREAVRGRPYNVTEIRYAIFPAHSGTLTVGPAELKFPEDVFDRFFSSRRSRGPSILRTDPVVIEVKDLPTPAPEGFSGLVAGRLDLRSTVDRDSVPRGEPVGLRVQLESDGFLKGFAGLTVPEPDGTRLHDAGENFSSGPQRERLIGSMSVEKVIVPAREGELALDPVEISWFDAGRGRYRIARSETHVVTVLPSDNPVAGEDDSGFLRNEIARLGQDLAFIHRGEGKLRRRAPALPATALWWALLLLPLLLLGAWRVNLLRLSADRRDPAGRRRRLALAAARRELKRADRLGDLVDRLDARARVVTRFVADCTGQPVAAVGAAEVKVFCLDLGTPGTGEELALLLDEADRVRYGGGSSMETEMSGSEIAGALADLHGRQRRPGSRAGAAGAAGAVALLLLLAIPGAEASAQPEATPAPGVDPARLLAEGNQAYTEGDVDRALGLYLQSRTAGADDVDLHFNLGNAYARRGQLGHAVASYLRAQRLAPRDGDVKTNLAWVRGHIRDLELDKGELPLFVAQAAAVIASFSLNEWSVVLVALVWLGAGLLAWAWWREDFGTHLRRALLGLGAAVLVVAVITAWRWHGEQVHRQAVVTAPVAAVRSGPAETFPVLFEVHDGLTLLIESEREDWVRVGLGGDWVGWIPAGSLEEVRLPDPVQGR